MAKRFIDTGMFDDPWFMDLSPDLKCFWMYAITKCNHAGILVLNKTLARIQIGCGDIETVLNEIGDRIIKISDDKYFIPKFIDFQYGTLKENNRVHVSVLDTLKKYNIKDLISPLQGGKDKDKDKDQDKDNKKNEKNLNDIDVDLNGGEGEFKKTILSDIEKSSYTKDKFLNDWNEYRLKYMGLPSNLNRLSVEEIENFNDFKKDYTRDDFKNAMEGLFKQNRMPNDNSVMQTSPSHFLKFVNRYLTAQQDKNYTLYGSDKKSKEEPTFTVDKLAKYSQ